MSFKPAQRTRVLLGDFSYSPKLNRMSLPHTVDMHDTTTFADEAKRFTPGQSTSTASLEGFHDTTSAVDAAAWTAAQPLTIGPEDIAFGSPVLMVDALRAQFVTAAQASGVVTFTLEAQADGFTGLGVSLHDLTAETSDSSSAAHDGGAATAAGGHAHLHVTEFAGFSGVAVTVEDSANGTSGWAAIGTFATVAGVTGERIALSTTVRRYLRATWDVTGSGSITFAVSAARN